MNALKSLLPALATAGLFAGLSSAAGARGTALIQQHDGSVKTYARVWVAVEKESLVLTSADGEGTLVLGKAACTKEGELIRCIPYDATLFQDGEKTHIPLTSGTVWLNPTADAQPLSHSSARLQPHGVLMSVNTKAGTYVSLTGTVDEVQK